MIEVYSNFFGRSLLPSRQSLTSARYQLWCPESRIEDVRVAPEVTLPTAAVTVAAEYIAASIATTEVSADYSETH